MEYIKRPKEPEKVLKEESERVIKEPKRIIKEPERIIKESKEIEIICTDAAIQSILKDKDALRREIEVNKKICYFCLRI